MVIYFHNGRNREDEGEKMKNEGGWSWLGSSAVTLF
jgi:hypothetical protein